MAKRRKLLVLALALIFSLSATFAPPASARDDPGIAEPNGPVMQCSWCFNGNLSFVAHRESHTPPWWMTSCKFRDYGHYHYAFTLYDEYCCSNCGTHYVYNGSYEECIPGIIIENSCQESSNT